MALLAKKIEALHVREVIKEADAQLGPFFIPNAVLIFLRVAPVLLALGTLFIEILVKEGYVGLKDHLFLLRVVQPHEQIDLRVFDGEHDRFVPDRLASL